MQRSIIRFGVISAQQERRDFLEIRSTRETADIAAIRKRKPARAVRYGMVYSMRPPESSKNDWAEASFTLK